MDETNLKRVEKAMLKLASGYVFTHPVRGLCVGVRLHQDSVNGILAFYQVQCALTGVITEHVTSTVYVRRLGEGEYLAGWKYGA